MKLCTVLKNYIKSNIDYTHVGTLQICPAKNMATVFFQKSHQYLLSVYTHVYGLNARVRVYK